MSTHLDDDDDDVLAVMLLREIQLYSSYTIHVAPRRRCRDGHAHNMSVMHGIDVCIDLYSMRDDRDDRLLGMYRGVCC